MSWNYRVLHICYRQPETGEDPVHYYSIRETYYADDNERITAIGAEAARPGGETLTEVMKDLAQMQEAFTRPVLTPKDITGYVLGTYEMEPA